MNLLKSFGLFIILLGLVGCHTKTRLPTLQPTYLAGMASPENTFTFRSLPLTKTATPASPTPSVTVIRILAPTDTFTLMPTP